MPDDVIVVGAGPAGTIAAIVLARAGARVRVLDRAVPDLIAVTGGDTAYAVIRALHPRRFDLAGAPADGLALGRLVLDDVRSLALLTKAGGFGEADLLTALLGGSS